MTKNFKKLQIKQPPAQQQTKKYSEANLWKKFKVSLNSSKFSAVTSLYVCPSAPYDFAVTCGTRVQVYAGDTKTIRHEFTKFTDIAYGASLRDDGKLLCTGGKEGVVQVFDVNNRNPLRKYRKHQGPVRSTRFVPHTSHLISGSDDKTLRLFDIPTQSQLCLFEAHEDQVRCVAPLDSNVFVTGSYDHTVRIWDARTGRCSITMTCDGPVEALQILPGNSLLASADGTCVRFWDILSAGRPTDMLSNHHKTITCLCLDGERTRLLSGGLDQHVKIYSLQTHEVCAQLDFPAPLLAVAVTPNNESLIAGLANGVLTVRTQKIEQEQKEPKIKIIPGQVYARPVHNKIFGGTLRHFMRGQEQDADDVEEPTAEAPKRAKLGQMDKLLRSFQYHKALDHALETNNPLIVVTLLEELFVRDGVVRAVAGRTEEGIVTLLSFIVKHITHPSYSKILTQLAHVVLDQYGDQIGQSIDVDELIERMRDKLAVEIRLQFELNQLNGLIDMLGATCMQITQSEAVSTKAEQLDLRQMVEIDDKHDHTPSVEHPDTNGIEPMVVEVSEETVLDTNPTPSKRRKTKQNGGS
eukprot:c5735_g1_i3.p1 GENE.c5735_g1_i3~~c5735_g1_i3.p1  ORF type:complete len:598 (+),score=98.04 c5735_g1_i3:56-1795(+)